MTSIGEYAFYGCDSLTSITIPKSVEDIDDYAIGYDEDSNENTVKIPGFIIYGYSGTAAERYALENNIDFGVIRAGNDPVPDIVSGDIFIVSNEKYKVNEDLKTVTYISPVNKKIKKAKIPEKILIKQKSYKVTKINDLSFEDCTKLKTVEIGSNVFSIGASAFQGCSSLSKVMVGKNVTTIGKRAFSGCVSLVKMTFKGGKLKKVGAKALDKAGRKNYGKLKIIVPVKKHAAYKRMLIKAGLNKKAKFEKM